jgi:hypothetical protein
MLNWKLGHEVKIPKLTRNEAHALGDLGSVVPCIGGRRYQYTKTPSRHFAHKRSLAAYSYPAHQ